jgi:hypothetical protein
MCPAAKPAGVLLDICISAFGGDDAQTASPVSKELSCGLNASP